MGGGNREWEYFTSANGRNKVADDVRSARLTAAEVARLEVVQQRVAEHRTRDGDVKDLGDDILEVRAKGNRRELRLLFSEQGGGLVQLALHVFVKKQQKTPPGAKRTALQRLKDWQRGQP